MLGTKEFLGAGAAQVLDGVHVHAAAVVASAGVALGVFVGEVTAHDLHDRPGDVVLRGDELQVVALALHLQIQGLEDRRIGIAKCFVHGHGTPR